MSIETKIEQLFRHRILLHAGFWSVTLIFAVLGEVNGEKAVFNWKEILHLFVHFIGFIVATYLNLYLLIPRFLVYRKYVPYFILVFLLATSTTFLTQLLQQLTSKYVLHFRIEEDLVFLFFHISFYCFFLMMLTSMFYFLRRKMSLQEMGVKLQEVEKQQVMSELKALKSQINPHFFFNTLNSIYSLSLENSPKTPEVVLKLSGLMRYVLYESSSDKVSLKKELEFVKNYIDLEKSRFEDSVHVQFEADEQKLAHYHVAPLLFIPFIENAFKHCNKSGAPVPVIKITFDTAQLPRLLFRVENTKEESLNNHVAAGGVGLENVKQRLNLIYPDKHTLKIDDEGGWYRIHLEVDLSLA